MLSNKVTKHYLFDGEKMGVRNIYTRSIQITTKKTKNNMQNSKKPIDMTEKNVLTFSYELTISKETKF